MYRENRRKITVPEDGRIVPFAISDNVYFVGTYQASVHLIDTGDGYILVDTGYKNTFDLVVESIKALGFDPDGVKYIVNTHWHGDHTQASGMMAELTGAKNVISRIDAPEVEKLGYFKPDVLLDDGDKLTLGNTTLEIMITPGHTKGTVSFTFDTTYNGKVYKVGMFGGAGANTLVHPHTYPGCREDYIASCDRLLGVPVEIFIGNHCWNNRTAEKGELIVSGGENLFIDGGAEWKKFLEYCRARCLSLPPL